ncbi:hypothetical protein GSI_13018 [Ganoderma sinense ZZ0214-1]|uniref:Uncharacterized protein n=1 Tax=Ganoderma sinense ZZ0214-1 TaxID=1077348 RepID=A0A2G8RUF3_9APHY|nr:hypothetical protein GSI_13018 [Ganoderma sinense ZZ0214-1]
MPFIPNLFEARDQNIPDVFFPEHLRLTSKARNWPAYKHAVETVCRLKGVADNLTAMDAYAIWHEDDDGREDWQWREELCKAIITLNIKDFPAHGVRAGEGVPARVVWARLCEIHRPKRRWRVLTELVRPPRLTRKEWLLLGVFFLLSVMELLFKQTRARLECERRNGGA